MLRKKGDLSQNIIFCDLKKTTFSADVAVLFLRKKNIVFVSVTPCYLAAICQRPPKRVGRIAQSL
jgi:hypothetical protein